MATTTRTPNAPVSEPAPECGPELRLHRRRLPLLPRRAGRVGARVDQGHRSSVLTVIGGARQNWSLGGRRHGWITPAAAASERSCSVHRPVRRTKLG